MNDDRLRALYDQLLHDRARRREASDVPLEAMQEILDRRGSEVQRLALLDRIMAHPKLAEEFEILRAAHEASRVVARRRIPAYVMGIAATLLVAVGISTIARRDTDQSGDPTRGRQVQVPLYAPAETSLADSARLFLWAQHPDARQYAFDLGTNDGMPVYAATVADTLLTLPDSVRLVPGETYRWWVRAVTTDGEVVSTLRQLFVRIR